MMKKARKTDEKALNRRAVSEASKKATTTSHASTSVASSAATLPAAPTIASTQCNCMVRGLPPSMDSAGLAVLANTVRPVVSARVIVDPVTDVSRQYGFVLFHTPADALAAVRALHRVRVGRRTITCRLAQSVISTEPMIASLNSLEDTASSTNNASSGSGSMAGSSSSVSSTSDAAPSNRLFVRGFPVSFTRSDLLQLFEPFGTVLECVLLMRANQRTSKQIALVSMLSLEQATAALQALHGYRIGDCPTMIDVRYRRRTHATHDDTASEDSFSSLNIVGLLSPQLVASPPPGSPPSALSPRSSVYSPIASWSPFSGAHTFLSPLSPFQSAFTPESSATSVLSSSADDSTWPTFTPKPATPPNQNKPKRERPKRRPTPLSFSAPGDVDAATSSASSSTTASSGSGSVSTTTNAASPLPTPAPNATTANDASSNCLFIHSETATAREDTLRALFVPFGPLRSVHVARAPDGTARGFGFVTFENSHDALAAKLALHGTLHEGRKLKVSSAKPKS